MINSQKPGFEDLYEAFHGFFMGEIQRDSSSWNRIRLQLLSQFFDDLALYKVINPVVARTQSNPEERRAIARAALWDVLMAYHMGKLADNIMAPPLDVGPVPVSANYSRPKTFTVEHETPATVASDPEPEAVIVTRIVQHRKKK